MFELLCSFVHKEATFLFLLIIIMFCILVSYIINVFIFLFIYFYTGPILIAVFITEMVMMFKHVIIIILYQGMCSKQGPTLRELCLHFRLRTFR